MTQKDIKHTTRISGGMIRIETYELGDLKYVEKFDVKTGNRIDGVVTWHGWQDVCDVGADGAISFYPLTDLISDRKGVIRLIDDLKRLDEFLVQINKNY